MSALGNILSTVSNIVPILIKPIRSVNGIQADAVLEEIHQDNLTITDHPVEQGATISDHAYKLPSEIILSYVWQTASPQNILSGNFDVSFLNSIYQQLLQLQSNRTLFDVFTGKRRYHNMLISALSVTTDRFTENVLSIRITCREIIVATTQLVQLPTSGTQASPNKTAPIVNQGFVSLGPAPNFNPTAVP